MRAHDHDEPAACPLDPARPEQAITEMAAACSNWGRWGSGDVRGTLNFLTDHRRLGRVRRRSRPGLSFNCAPWLHRTEIAAIATDTWGFEVRPNEFEHAFQPLHQVVIPHIGLYINPIAVK